MGVYVGGSYLKTVKRMSMVEDPDDKDRELRFKIQGPTLASQQGI